MRNALKITDKEELKVVIERNKNNGWPDLPAKRKAFAMHYVVGYNHRKASKQAGFSEDFGAELIREPLLTAYIAELQSQELMSNIVTEDFVRTQWLNLIPMLSGQVEVPIVLADGTQTYGRKFMAGELNSVLKELAKSTKFYEEGSGQGSQVNVNIDMGALLGRTEKVIDG